MPVGPFLVSGSQSPPPLSTSVNFHVSMSSTTIADTALGMASPLADSVSISAQAARFVTGSATSIRYEAASNFPDWGPEDVSGAIRMVIRLDEFQDIGRTLFNVWSGNNNTFNQDRMAFQVTTVDNVFKFDAWNVGPNASNEGRAIASSFPIAPVLGSVHEIELNFKQGLNACIWFYFDGVRSSTTLTGCWITSISPSAILFGSNAGSGADETWVGTMRDIRIFPTPQHFGSSYTPTFD